MLQFTISIFVLLYTQTGDLFMSALPTNKKYEIDMCNGPLMGKLISFSVPLILASNLQLLFNAVDIIVVGKFSGSQALAAVGSTTALINLVIVLMTGISLGASVMAGQFFATNDYKKMDDLVHTSIAFALGAGVLLGLIGIFLSKWALMLMDTPDQLLAQAVLYIRVYFLGTPFFMLYTYGAAILRAVGDTKRPLIFLTAAGILNAVLNMVLVIVFHLGVLGVGIATVVSQMISCILVLRCLMKVDGSYRLHISRLTIKFPYLKQMFKIGLPAGIQSLVINFSNVLLQSSVNSFGEFAMAGYTAANNVFGFMYATANSFTQTCMSFMSQNYGVRNWERMRRVLKDCIILSVGTMLVVGWCVYGFRSQILSIYTSEPESIKCGAEVFLYTTSTYFVFNIMDLLPGAMRGFGRSTVPMILSVIGTVGTRIFWIYCVFPYHHALDVLFVSYPLSWIITVVMQLVYFIFAWNRASNSN